MKITDEKLKQYFSSEGSLYALYDECKSEYDKLRIHADGIFPERLIKEKRPNEPPEIFEYRKKTYQPITQLPMSKVITSFSKIRRSPDWAIDYPDKQPATITDEETLEQYCTYNLPGYGSITDWAFGILLKQNLVDANALIAVIPIETPADKSTFYKPIPMLFNSDQVLEYNEKDKWCLVRSKRKVGYMDQSRYQTGSVFIYIDDQEIIIFEEAGRTYNKVYQQKNIIKQFPVFKVKAESYKQFDNMSLNRSRLNAMIPFLDEAASEYSDFMGSKVQHLYPLFWYFQNKDCIACNGTGKITAKTTGGQQTVCAKCDNGKIKFSPFASIAVEPSPIGAQNNPVPPAGFVVRDVEILKLQLELVEKNNLKAMSAVNMQFLDQTPLNISGDAKNVDRAELNNTVYNVAEDLIYSIDRVMYFINEWRYFVVVRNVAARKKLLPNIPVPQNFDLLPEDYLMKEVTDAITGKLSPFLIATLQEQLAVKKFYNQPELAGQVKLYFELDPLPAYTVDEKMSMLSNRGITMRDYVLTCYMASFTKRAIRENESFASMNYDEQTKILYGYADAKILENDKAAGMIDKNKLAVVKELANAS